MYHTTTATTTICIIRFVSLVQTHCEIKILYKCSSVLIASGPPFKLGSVKIDGNPKPLMDENTIKVIASLVISLGFSLSLSLVLLFDCSAPVLAWLPSWLSLPLSLLVSMEKKLVHHISFWLLYFHVNCLFCCERACVCGCVCTASNKSIAKWRHRLTAEKPQSMFFLIYKYVCAMRKCNNNRQSYDLVFSLCSCVRIYR